MSRNHKILIPFFCLSTALVLGQNLNLKIIGNDLRETEVIDSLGYSKKFENFELLKQETDSVLSKIEKLGYYESKHSDLKAVNDSVYNLSLDLGNRYKFIEIYHPELFQRKLIKNRLATKDDYHILVPVENIESVLRLISTLLSKDGDPFVQVKLANISKISNSSLKADLSIKNYSNRKIDKIVIKGYEKFPSSYIDNFLRIRNGQTFDLDRINSKISNLENLRFAKSQREPEALFTDDSTVLYIYVEKKNSNNFDGFLGFGTDENSGKLQLDGYLNLELLNNLNYGESLQLYYKSDESDQKTFDVEVNLPYLFSSPIGLKAKLNIFKKDSTFLSSRQLASLNYRINQNHTVASGVTVNRSDLLEVNTTTELADFKSQYFNFEYTFQILNPNSLLFPTKSFFSLLTEFGKRRSTVLENSQFRLSGEGYNIFPLNESNSIFTRISGGYLDSQDYFENELFRFGGINSIRGFKENTLVANLFGVINTEYRYQLNPDLYVHTVLDFSYLENQITEQKDKLLGFGFGFGLFTNAGLLKFNYSGSKVDNQKIKISDFKIHISLNARF